MLYVLSSSDFNKQDQKQLIKILSGSQPGNFRYFSFTGGNERTGCRHSVQL